MSPLDLNQVATISMSGGDDHDPITHVIFPVENETSSSSCLFNFFQKPHDQELLPQEPNDYSLMISAGSSYHLVSHPTSSDRDISNKIKLSLCKGYTEEEESEGPGKWMCPKMRVMKSMMSSQESKARGNMQLIQDQSQTDPPSGVIRVCSSCNTTKTPLWRSGPRGPKSLCNACGIRQRKARRAMEATAAMNGSVIPSDAPKSVQKEKKSADRTNHDTIPFKKRYKFTGCSSSTQNSQLCKFEDVTVGLGTNSALIHEVYPQDERDAAILLMALSCGLIRS